MAKAELQDEVLPEADLKRLLKQVKDGKRYSCAVVQSDDKKQAAISVDRRKKGKKLAKTLRGTAGVNVQTLRFGYVAADGSTMVLHTNKPMPPTMIQQMKPIGRRGAGFTEVVNLVNEALEDESDEDAPEEEGADTATPPASPVLPAAEAPRAAAAAEPAPPRAPETPPPPPTAAAPASNEAGAAAAADPSANDKARARLAALIKMVAPAAAAYPAKKAMLVELANDAKTSVLAGDDATQKLAALEAALRDIAKARTDGHTPEGAAPATDDAAKARLVKADQIWAGARTQMRQNLDHLKKAVVDAYADNAAAQGAVRGSLGQLDSLFSWMDGRLEGKIGAALKAGTPEERRSLARESATIAADYFKAAKAQDRIKDLDDNPFDVATRFGETIDKLLPQLERAMREIA